MLQGRRAHRFRARTLGPMTLHLARSGALENAGIALHPLYGFVWLPGSGLKGMARAWAETIWAPAQPDAQAAWATIFAVFGTGPPAGKKAPWIPRQVTFPDEQAGNVVFHDAWPVAWPKLERDIVNNHHTKYYSGEGAPGDWEEPTLVSFLAVPSDTLFDFAVSCRTETTKKLAHYATEWLKASLVHAGAGAKTAAGYGRFEILNESHPKSPAAAWLKQSTHMLELVTPAFLAGADQRSTDCTLRPATLRGLLRWWWRTMHADNLSRQDLLTLEGMVWGNTEHGSRITISLEDKSDRPEPRKYSKHAVSQHLKSASRNPRVRHTQGLFYVAYGMDERGSTARYYRLPGDRWELTMVAHDGSQSGKTISAGLLLRQAQASLWLLTRFGGAGSKARKGFGSFCDLEIDGIRSISHCKEIGAELRKAAGLSESGRCGTPALESMIGPIEVRTNWSRDHYWHALDRVGAVYQRFVKEKLTSQDERMAMGLPRRFGKWPIKSTKGDTRHASPTHWSVGRAGRLLTLRLVGFPSERLPSQNISERVLQDLMDFAQDKLSHESEQAPRQAVPDSVGKVRPTGLPSGTQVQVTLCGRTNKGGWRAKLPDGPPGPIIDSANVDPAVKLGDTLTVFTSSTNPKVPSFRVKPLPKKKQRGGHKHGRSARPRGKRGRR